MMALLARDGLTQCGGGMEGAESDLHDVSDAWYT
jgi:hypothetical protein